MDVKEPFRRYLLERIIWRREDPFPNTGLLLLNLNKFTDIKLPQYKFTILVVNSTVKYKNEMPL